MTPTYDELIKWETAIQDFVKDNPGKPIPTALLRWLFNMASEADIQVARKRLAEMAKL